MVALCLEFDGDAVVAVDCDPVVLVGVGVCSRTVSGGDVLVVSGERRSVAPDFRMSEYENGFPRSLDGRRFDALRTVQCSYKDKQGYVSQQVLKEAANMSDQFRECEP